MRLPPLAGLLVGLAAVACGAPPEHDGPERGGPMVFAAASLGQAMEEVTAAWVAAGGAPPRLNVAGSNVLARQLLAAPDAADVFVSADEAWLDALADRDLLAPGSRRTLLSNRLVVIARRGAELPAIAAATDLERLAGRRWVLADPEAVPAGRYARGFLAGVALADGSLWDRLAPRVVPTADVTAALALVAADDRLVGVVYGTDAAASDAVAVVYAVPAAAAPPIRYGAAVLAAAPRPAAAARFLAFLAGPAPEAVFRRRGFVLPADLARDGGEGR